jgi:hypothetical protein
MAGEAAAARFTKQPLGAGWQSHMDRQPDYQHALELAKRITIRAKRHVLRARPQAARLLESPTHWRAVQRLAESLLAQETVTGNDAHALIRAALNE